MSWLARITVSREQMRELCLVDDYAWHQFSWMCQPKDPDASRTFLTRIDRAGDGGQMLILARQKPQKPEKLSEHSWECKRIADSFLQHRKYRFSIRANPTVRKAAGGPKGRRIGIHDSEQQVAWLIGKGLRGGFEILPEQVTVTGSRNHQFSAGKNRRITLTSADFHGILTVTDQKQFEETFFTGIGSSKSFGMGMLLLQPIDLT